VSRQQTRFTTLTRREFTSEAVMALLAGVSIVISGCGSGSGSSSPTAPSSNSGDFNGAISANHGHVATVTAAQVTSPASVSLNIRGTETHDHTISLSADQIRTIGARTQVSVVSTSEESHIELQCIRSLRMDLGKDLVAASATPLVLAILAEGESYGYAIIKRVTELSQGHLQWTDGMLYPVLHRLERNGLVAAKWGESESGRRRKYYRLTRDGRSELEAERRRWQIVDQTLHRVWMQAYA
jgi:DNA-binding PadR family transcriptional regulator